MFWVTSVTPKSSPYRCCHFWVPGRHPGQIHHQTDHVSCQSGSCDHQGTSCVLSVLLCNARLLRPERLGSIHLKKSHILHYFTGSRRSWTYCKLSRAWFHLCLPSSAWVNATFKLSLPFAVNHEYWQNPRNLNVQWRNLAFALPAVRSKSMPWRETGWWFSMHTKFQGMVLIPVGWITGGAADRSIVTRCIMKHEPC